MPDLTTARKRIVDGMLKSTATLFSRNSEPNELNEEIITWEEEEEEYPCRVTLQSDRMGGNEEDFADTGTVTGQTRYIIKLPWDCPVTRLDQIEVDGIRYEVSSTNSEHTDRLLLNAFCHVTD